MNIYLLRHGRAAERDPFRFPDDRLRPLTPRGREQMREIALAMGRLALEIDAIWTSPLARAHATAMIVADALRLEHVVEIKAQLAPEGDGKVVEEDISRSAPAPTNLLLVGHEPNMSQLLSQLASGGSAIASRFRKGGLAKLRVTGALGDGNCATLEWLLTPKIMELIAPA